MMEFRVIKDALTDLLNDNALGRFRVVGRQVHSKSQNEIINNDRLVQVYFSDGNFPRDTRMHGQKTHEITIEIDMSASATATGNLSVLEDQSSTSQQKASAILAIKEASFVADLLIDELIEYVYQIIMDARNENLGLPKGSVSSRWVGKIQKDTLLERGDLVVKTANMKYTCKVQEVVAGDVGYQPSTIIFNSSTSVDEFSSTGVTIENDNL